MVHDVIGDPTLVYEGNDDAPNVYLARFMCPVLEHTAQLFAILEWADHATARPGAFVGDDEPTGHCPFEMSVSLVSTPVNATFSAVTEGGAEGRLTQLAFKGWIALVAGVWESFRKAKPLHDRETGHPMGMLTPLYGDIQKIRNDVLKNNGVAKHAAKCELLKWFDKGETIRFKVDHVLEILHRIGQPLGSYLLIDVDRGAVHALRWRVRSSSQAPTPALHGTRQPPWRVVSTLAMVEESKQERVGYDLGLSIMFADGVVGGFLIESSNEHQRLMKRKEAIERAPKDHYGCPVIPGLGSAAVIEMHDMALNQLRDGNAPIDPGTPAMQFKRAPTDRD